MPQAIQSDAFDRASLRSERIRIIGILGLFVVFWAANTIYALVKQDPEYFRRLKIYMWWWGTLATYEAVMLVITVRAERAGRQVQPGLWIINTVIECLFPSIALFGLTIDRAYLGPYRALYSPTVLVYVLFIILSTLRLRPPLSFLAGVVCAAGYAGVHVFTVHISPDHPARTAMPPETYLFTPILLLCAGLIAGGVAKQIREHVMAALAEAETRRKLDRIELELSTARSIQMGLLPSHPPKISGYDIAGWSQPADQTGGDYYDWMELPGGKVLFTIADATGHGIGPALLVAACRAYFRAMATRSDPLEKITQQVDELLAADVPAGRFITAAIALLEPGEHRLSLYSAGHAPIYLYEAAGDRINAFAADQPPLGIGMGDGDGEMSQARVFNLAAGDAMVLVTDGLFECANLKGELRGTRQLGESIRQHQALDADKLIARLHEEVQAYSEGTPQADDMTAVVIKRRPQ